MTETNNLSITKERLKGWAACTDGYRWFIEKFPQGGDFAEVHSALQADKRYDDSVWLVDRLFAELATPERVQQTVLLAGADAANIQASVESGADAATTGEGANAATTGYRANAATTGYGANAATTGNWANAATTGNWANAATTGRGAISASLGIDAKAKAGQGGAIVLARRDSSGALLGVKAAMVGQDGIKPGIWYSLDEAGEFVEVL